MTLQSSGAISFNNINVELAAAGVSATQLAPIDGAPFRNLAGIPASGTQISLSNFYGKQYRITVNLTLAGGNVLNYDVFDNRGPTYIAGISDIIVTVPAPTTVGSTTVVQSGDVVGSLSFQASDGTEFVETARIQSLVDGTPGANDMPGTLLFSTTADGAASSTERARITSGGNFGVGTTTPGTSYSELVNFTATATNQPSLTLLNTNGSFANDVFQIRGANTSANGNSWNMITGWSSTTSLNFLVRGNGNVLNSNNSYGSLSDQRLKENIVDATPKLEKLNQVRVVNFNMIGDEQKQIGVVAQELEQVFPGMVEEDQEGIKAVKYSVFVPMLIKAIQEQQQMIETLQAKVAALENA